MSPRIPLLATVALAAALNLAAAPAPALAFDAAQTRDIETIVHEYLVAHPEVLLEAMNALEAKRVAQERSTQKQTIEAAKAELTESPDGTVVGNPDGDVTVTEFFDYNCGYCKRAASDMEALLGSDPKLRVVLKEIPVLGPASEAASRVSLAFRSLAPDRYGAFQKALLASRGPVDQARALAVAADFGVEAGALTPLLDGPAVRAALEQSGRLAGALGISGTPSYVISDEVVAGAVGADVLASKIGNVRACGSATC